ncbi:MAG: SIS domain-containing protein [Deltaproteobacteria bacterium]|nr:SIS domain-containing protein [Deltaproteobacteria bacterium]
MTSWLENAQEIGRILSRCSIRDEFGAELQPDSAFDRWQAATARARADGRTVYLIGNGASASMASHVAADLAKNAHVHTEVFSDLALLTAIANDLCYEEVFAEPLRRRMRRGDLLVAISSSGRSPNILRAASEAKDLGGFVVTLSAMRADNPLRLRGMLNCYVPAETYGLAETCHAGVLHHWIDLMTASLRETDERAERALEWVAAPPG